MTKFFKVFKKSDEIQLKSIFSLKMLIFGPVIYKGYSL